MRILVVLICNFALAFAAYGAQQEQNKSQKKKQAQPAQAQHAAQPTRHPAGGGGAGKKAPNTGYQGQNARKGQTSAAAYNAQKGKKNQTAARSYEGRKVNQGQTSAAAYQAPKGKKNQTAARSYEGRKVNQGQTAAAAYQGQKGKKSQTQVERQTAQRRQLNGAGQTVAAGKPAQGKPFKPQHFNVAKQPNTAKAPAVRFQQGRRIQGSQNWQGSKYTVFRNYSSQWHDRNWWSGHYNRVVFVYGGWYAWNAGYWIPAWGYAPNAYYAYDGPIYGYNNLPPDQVIANVQSALQQQGYYQGEVDGLLGPQTRAAVADYQRANGLAETASVDQPTLESLGMS